MKDRRIKISNLTKVPSGKALVRRGRIRLEPTADPNSFLILSIQGPGRPKGTSRIDRNKALRIVELKEKGLTWTQIAEKEFSEYFQDREDYDQNPEAARELARYYFLAGKKISNGGCKKIPRN